jgi:hypothetical protein
MYTRTYKELKLVSDQSCDIANLFIWANGGSFGTITSAAHLERFNMAITSDFDLFQMKCIIELSGLLQHVQSLGL